MGGICLLQKSVFMLKKLVAVLFIAFSIQPVLFAQQAPQENKSAPRKYALVIGNGAYHDLTQLANPVNDANDMAVVLGNLGFTVDKVLNGSIIQMEEGVTRLKNRLSNSDDSYGFFFYAGHGVQSNGENYLIPVDADIPSESYLRNRALSVQIILDDLNEAGNNLNVVVLDACRDNPFGWGRSTSRGLAVMSGQPAGSIIVYATSAGQRASDGEGRNGLFTSQLLNNLADPSLEVSEVFRRTGANVSRLSNNRQIPAIYSQFFDIAYLGAKPKPAEELVQAQPSPEPAASVPQPIAQPLPSPEPAERIVISPSPAKPEKQYNDTADRSRRLTTLGATQGTTFSAPWLTTTFRGSFALGNKGSALEIGFEFGYISGKDKEDYSSYYPFLHYLYFTPFKNKGGWYAGGGMGWMIGKYTYSDGKDDDVINTPALDMTAGVLLMNFLDISYTLRTNFVSASNKFAVGFSYRFN